MALTKRQLKETCWHEAGHVVVARLLGGHVERVSVNRDGVARTFGDRGASANYGSVERSPVRSVADNIAISFAGMEAQFTALQGRTWSEADFEENADDDRGAIVAFGRLLVAEGGDGDDILHAAVRRARDLVLDHRSDIEKVARALLTRGSLGSEDLDALLGPMTVHNEMDDAGFAELEARIARANGEQQQRHEST